MYKLLLCWRYLRTRYIALASIISVMLGVGTMIVVNSVMAGFTTEMQHRLHGILADLTFKSVGLDGMPDAEWHIEQIRAVAGDSIEAMTPTVVVPAVLNFQHRGKWVTHPVEIVGINEKTQSGVSDFGKYLQHPENRTQMSFALREGGYDTRDHQAPNAPERKQMRDAGWVHRRRVAQQMAFQQRMRKPDTESEPPPEALPQHPLESDGRSQARPKNSSLPVVDYQNDREPADLGIRRLQVALRSPRSAQPEGNEFQSADAQPPAPSPESLVGSSSAAAEAKPALPANPFAGRAETNQLDPAKEQRTGAVLGIALASFRTPEGEDRFLALPGDDVQLTLPTVGRPPKGISDTFTIVDFYESKMSEYDGRFVFVPIRKLQELRGMIDPTTNQGMISSIQIKLKPGADGAEVRDRLRAHFPSELYAVYTWRDAQGPLLAAVEMETAILNVLLFLIIAVAGFGILAIFLMIVVEKTRDIGILKSLGASGQGVMGIFLAYGLSLGLVGSGVGLVLGLLFVRYINQIADLLGKITGRPVFDPSIYYFHKIPTIVNPMTVAWIMAGAITIAVLASILPALRAALLRPVEALRYE